MQYKWCPPRISGRFTRAASRCWAAWQRAIFYQLFRYQIVKFASGSFVALLFKFGSAAVLLRDGEATLGFLLACRFRPHPPDALLIAEIVGGIV